MRALLSLALLPLLATFAPFSLYKQPTIPARPLVIFEPVVLNEDDPAQRRLGRLVFLEGWQLRSNDPRFGGLSAMNVAGGRVTAISDGGFLMRFRLGDGPIAPLDISMIEDGPGSKDIKRDRDTEALAVHGGRAWVVFERRNSVWRYSAQTWRGRAAAAPPGMDDWSANSGGEAIVRLPDGRFVIFSEAYRRPDGSTQAILFDGDPVEARTKAVEIGYRGPQGYRITDAVSLPDGGILFLNRRFTFLNGFTAKLTLAPQPRLAKGDVLSGVEIAHFEAPVAADNLEALSVDVENGRPVLWIASDDNHTSLQRTLLMKFALDAR
jgi:hypothetical protein